MSTDTSRSAQVIEDYKRHKLASCALRRINDLIRGFEAERTIDRRLAQLGLILMLALIVASAYFLMNTDRLILF